MGLILYTAVISVIFFIRAKLGSDRITAGKEVFIISKDTQFKNLVLNAVVGGIGVALVVTELVYPS